MSTPCELVVYASSKILADKSANDVLLETKRLEKKYNYYDSTSVLSLINKRELQELDKETKDLLNRAKKYYKATNGVFDVTIATIKSLFESENSSASLESKIQNLKCFLGCDHFYIKKDKIIFDNLFTKIDFGGFVKEYAVDRAVKVLKKNKIQNALVNYGGDIYALGKKPNGEFFKIGIKDPQNLKQYAKEVSLCNQALTTSASYERNYNVGDKNYSHIIATVKKTSDALSISVVAPSTVEAGVYSTSLMINISLETKNKVIML